MRYPKRKRKIRPNTTHYPMGDAVKFTTKGWPKKVSALGGTLSVHKIKGIRISRNRPKASRL